MPLFVVLREGAELDADLVAEIKRPRHVPDAVLQVDGVPRTRSGKPLEVPVKRILMGIRPEEAASRATLADPHSLDYFADLHSRWNRQSAR
jgi:acetoacetyl-CoA synthetase